MNETAASSYLPQDGFAGTLIGRVWVPERITSTVAGPSPMMLSEEGVFDLSPIAATCGTLLNNGFDRSAVGMSQFKRLGSYDEIMANTMCAQRDADLPYFITPVDIQSIKACGVTFMVSMLEHVIEERAGGDAAKADDVRKKIKSRLDADITDIQSGSPEAEALKEVLQAEGLWSQYVEVGLGPYAEVFTKAQPLSTVGTGAEVVLLVNAEAQVLGRLLPK